jgi:hypothetical protein
MKTKIPNPYPMGFGYPRGVQVRDVKWIFMDADSVVYIHVLSVKQI